MSGWYQDSFNNIWTRKLSDSQTMPRATVAPMATQKLVTDSQEERTSSLKLKIVLKKEREGRNKENIVSHCPSMKISLNNYYSS